MPLTKSTASVVASTSAVPTVATTQSPKMPTQSPSSMTISMNRAGTASGRMPTKIEIRNSFPMIWLAAQITKRGVHTNRRMAQTTFAYLCSETWPVAEVTRFFKPLKCDTKLFRGAKLFRGTVLTFLRGTATALTT